LFSLHHGGACAAGRTLGSATHGTNVNLEFLHGPAESIAVHAELARGFALVSFILFKHGYDKALFEFPDGFRVENIAFIHLKDECFELIFQLLPLFRTFDT
jgi:hypothetical protein